MPIACACATDVTSQFNAIAERPASATNIYTGNGIAHAVAPDGKRYSELATAFAYRQKIIPGCTCNGRDAFGLVNTGVADDPTLRPGDIIATNAGLMAYNGGGTNGSTFTPISTYAGLLADLRRQLTETKIEPDLHRCRTRCTPNTNAN